MSPDEIERLTGCGHCGMSEILGLLDLRPGDAEDTWIGPASGPEGKRSYGGQFMAQSLAAACRTVDADRPPTNMHLQFLRGGEAGEPVEYTVTRVFDGRTAAARRVDSRQNGRLLTDRHGVLRDRVARPRTWHALLDAARSRRSSADRPGGSGALDAVGRTRHQDRRRGTAEW